MKLQISTDYAVRILQYLHQNPGLQCGADMAGALDIAYPTLRTIVNRLRQKGLVASTKGKSGGYMLAKSAAEISFYDVFLCIEKSLCISQCLNGDSNGTQEDGISVAMQGLQDKIIMRMSAQNIADLAS